MQSATESVRLLTACEIIRDTYRPINHVEAATLRSALSTDAEKVAQTVFASLAEAMLSVSGRRFTWATVELYYSAFYSIKALTMLDGTSIFYRRTTPFSIRAQPGQVFRKRKGNSHSVTFDEFRLTHRNDVLLSQPIGGASPLSWIEGQRNIASYKTAPFPDPQCPPQFSVQYDRLRLHVSSYFAEDTPVYPFQEDHAMIAYPILCLRRLDQELARQGKTVQIDQHYITILMNAGCDVGALTSLDAFVTR